MNIGPNEFKPPGSDGSVLGPVLKDRPDRAIFARTGPPEDRSKKTERPRSFFGPFFGRKHSEIGVKKSPICQNRVNIHGVKC